MSKNKSQWSSIEVKVGFKFLDRITARYWSTIIDSQSGVGMSIHQNEGGLNYLQNYLRIGEINQRELKREIIRKFLQVMQTLEDIILMKRFSSYFHQWKLILKKKKLIRILDNDNDSCYELKYLFRLWKQHLLISKMNKKWYRQGSIILFTLLIKSNHKRLLRSFQKWLQWTKFLTKLVRKCFDSWSLWTLQSKLHQANVLRFCKIFLSCTKRKSPKRIRWYFETWHYHSTLIGKYTLLKKSLSLWKCSVRMNRSRSQQVLNRHQYYQLKLGYYSWKKLFSMYQMIRLLARSLSGYLLQYYYMRWVLFHQAQRLLKNWIRLHLANIESFPPPLKSIQFEPPPTLSVPPSECISTPNKSHKSCRCVRCLSRYGHLGAKTRGSYSQSPLPSSQQTPILKSASSPFSKLGLRSSHESSFAISQDHPSIQSEVHDSFTLNNEFSIDPPIVVIESTCTVTDHLKYRIQSITQLTKEYEKKKSVIKQAKGKKIIITPKKKFGY